MKIAVVIDRLNVGGVEKIAIEEVKALRELGQEAYLVVLRRRGVVDNAFLDLRKDLPTIFLDDRLPEIFKLSFKFPVFSFFSFFHVTYPFLIPYVVRRSEFDYVIAHGTYTAFTAVGLKILKNLKYSVYIWDPIVYILNRVYTRKLALVLAPLVYVAKLLDALIIKNCDYVLVGGNAHNKYIKSLSSTSKIKIIPPSVHPIKKTVKKKDDYIILVTAWKEGKNPEYVFELAERIKGARFVLVGKWLDAAYKNKFNKDLKEKKLSTRIDIIGEVNELELSQYYSQAVTLLQINDDRGFGMPALEAAAHGTTFVIPEGQGVCALFRHGIDGYFVKEKNTEEIVDVIQRLLSDKDQCLRMGVNAWKTVNHTASWKKHAESLVEVINK